MHRKAGMLFPGSAMPRKGQLSSAVGVPGWGQQREGGLGQGEGRRREGSCADQGWTLAQSALHGYGAGCLLCSANYLYTLSEVCVRFFYQFMLRFSLLYTQKNVSDLLLKSYAHVTKQIQLNSVECTSEQIYFIHEGQKCNSNFVFLKGCSEFQILYINRFKVMTLQFVICCISLNRIPVPTGKCLFQYQVDDELQPQKYL